MNGYDIEDEYDVAQGIYDALLLKMQGAAGMNGIQWLGWKIGEPCLGEFDIEASGMKFRVIVEPIEAEQPEG